MKKIILIILVLNSIYTCGQNDFSKNLETKIVNDSVQVDFFKALFSIDSLISNVEIEKNRNKVQKTIKFSRQKEKKEKHERKRIKRIYNTIHNTFLEKYNIEAHFSDIFINGNYNCVSATALYSYVFESLEIPYKIKETPTHVYLVVYPKSYKIYIEIERQTPHSFTFSLLRSCGAGHVGKGLRARSSSPNNTNRAFICLGW